VKFLATKLLDKEMKNWIIELREMFYKLFSRDTTYGIHYPSPNPFEGTSDG
jgi:hypothetical protein